MLAASSCLSAETIVTADSLRYHLAADGRSVELTYLSHDSANVRAYWGDVMVPASIAVDQQRLPVTGVTPFACVYCEGLQSVTLSEGVTHIGFGAFSDCAHLSSVALPSSLTTLSDWAFYRDASLKTVSVPRGVKRVGACAFAFCTALDSLALSMGVRAIGQHAFYYCSSLTQLYIPGTVHQIGEYAFAYNTALTQVTTDGAPVAITPDVFEGVDVSRIRLVVPSDQVEAYREMEVWCDFQIIDGGYDDLDLPAEDSSDFTYRVAGSTLYLNVNGDAPALVYDLQGRRIAVIASRSGETHLSLQPGYYLIRCGRAQAKLTF